MGQGQEIKAITMIREAASLGHLVCIQNAHLMMDWINTSLARELQLLKAHEKFRLILISEPHELFQANFLANCLTLMIEAPPGIKNNLTRIYEIWDAHYISSGSIVRAQALFSLAWFHSIIQERRKYIPQGWNKFYEFSITDLKSSAVIIDVQFSLTHRSYASRNLSDGMP